MKFIPFENFLLIDWTVFNGSVCEWQVIHFPFSFFTIFVHFFDTSPISCYFLHCALFLSCTFIMLHTFHTGFCPCYIFPCFCFIYATHFVSRKTFILQSSMLCQFHVAPFSGYFLFHASFMLCCTLLRLLSLSFYYFLTLNYFHIALFVSWILSIFHFSLVDFSQVELFSCCTITCCSILRFLRLHFNLMHSFYFTLFCVTYCTFFMLQFSMLHSFQVVPFFRFHFFIVIFFMLHFSCCSFFLLYFPKHS